VPTPREELLAAIEALQNGDHRAKARALYDKADGERSSEAAWKQTQDEWSAGVSKLTATQKANVNRAAMLGGEKFVSEMQRLGVAHHPELIATLDRIGAEMYRRESQGQAQPAAEPAAQTLHHERTPEQLAAAYPSMVGTK
jgi:hypothetical protein